MSQAVKVSKLVSYLKSKLDEDNLIQGVIVQGEISNFTNHRSGHWYFTLKDEKSRINCVMFASSANKVKFKVKDGDKVLVRCNTSIFESSGQLQLYVTAMKLDGQGDLYLQFEEIKNRLNEEGLFDIAHKKPIPAFPLKVGLITGRNTAAREDVVSTISRRWPICTVFELNILVQGEGSSKQLIEAVKKLDLMKLDVILMVRGGGSIEDLWSFNDENLARTIYEMKTPLICGVGHEVDVTIVDYVCDKRAPTPTGAAEMATPNLNDVLQQIDNYKTRMKIIISKDFENYGNKLNKLSNSYVFTNPLKLYEQKQLALDLLMNGLYSYRNVIKDYRNNLKNISYKFVELSRNLVNENDKNIKLMHNSLINLMNFILNNSKKEFIKNIKLLDAYSPLKVMERGYSLVYLKDKLVNKVNDIEIDDEIRIKLYDGEVISQVRKVIK